MKYKLNYYLLNRTPSAVQYSIFRPIKKWADFFMINNKYGNVYFLQINSEYNTAVHQLNKL